MQNKLLTMTGEEKAIEQAAIKMSEIEFDEKLAESFIDKHDIGFCLSYDMQFAINVAKSPEAKAFHTKGMYSKEEVYQMFQKYGMDRLEEELRILGGAMESFESFTIDEWFEQNKKK